MFWQEAMRRFMFSDPLPVICESLEIHQHNFADGSTAFDLRVGRA